MMHEYNTQLRVLQADWLILENNEKVTLNINMPYYLLHPTGSLFMVIYVPDSILQCSINSETPNQWV